MNHSRQRVGHAYDQHSQMQQRNHHREQRGLLAAVRRSRGGKNPRRLTLQLAVQPELRCGVDERLHLRCHIPVACWAAEDYAICGAKIVERAFWDRRLRVVYLLRITALFIQVLYSIRKLPGPTQHDVGSSYALCSSFNALINPQTVSMNC